MTVENQDKWSKTGPTVSFPPSLALILKANALIEIMKERCAGALQATHADKIAHTSICEWGAPAVFCQKRAPPLTLISISQHFAPSFHLKNKKRKNSKQG